MSCFDKENYKELKAMARAEGVKTAVFPTLSDNGFVVAYQKKEGMRMVVAAVSYCSPDDKFKPRHGKYQALLKAFDGEYVQLPIGMLSDESIENVLASTFDI